MTLSAKRSARKRGEARTFFTVRERIAWSYANVARAHAALADGRKDYVVTDHMIRAKLFKGLCDGRMSIGTMFDDERRKLNELPHCVYCGSLDRLGVDHVIARTVGGSDDGANLVRACASCNSSKRDLDMMEWLAKQGMFPSLLLYRRYLKIVSTFVAEAGLLDVGIGDGRLSALPFDIRTLPADLPPLATLRL